MSSCTMTSMLPEVSAFLRRDHGPYINGRWTPSDGTPKLRVFNPATVQVIAHVVDASACDATTRSALLTPPSPTDAGDWLDAYVEVKAVCIRH
jgi:acyl-CoA reductase-like NAD-dependent aldehyde dehydrogenase